MSQIVTQTNTMRLPDTLFETLHLDNFRPAEFCLALLLGLASCLWRQHWRGPAKLLDAMRQLRYQLARDPIMDELATCWARPGACYSLLAPPPPPLSPRAPLVAGARVGW